MLPSQVVVVTGGGQGIGNGAAYDSTKSGITGLARQLGSEQADRGVRVNCVAPGYTPTEGSYRKLDDEEAITAGWSAAGSSDGRARVPERQEPSGGEGRLRHIEDAVDDSGAGIEAGERVAGDCPRWSAGCWDWVAHPIR